MTGVQTCALPIYRTKANLLIFVTPTLIEGAHFQAPSTDFLQGQTQPSATDFLQQRPPAMQDKPDSFLDTRKPKDSGKTPAAPAKP